MNIIKDRSCNTIYHIPPPLEESLATSKKQKQNITAIQTNMHASVQHKRKSHIPVKCAEVRSVHVSFGFDVDNELVVWVAMILPAMW